MLWRGLTSFLMSPYTMHGSQAGTTRARTLGFSYTILDRIAEVVKAFPCLYFRARLTFRHRPIYVRLSQMTSEVFCDGLSCGGEEYRTRGSHLRSRSTMNICNSTMSDIMESGYIKISEPHHLDRLKMLSASVRDGHIWGGVET